jgi:hypothetical protein
MTGVTTGSVPLEGTVVMKSTLQPGGTAFSPVNLAIASALARATTSLTSSTRSIFTRSIVLFPLKLKNQALVEA